MGALRVSYGVVAGRGGDHGGKLEASGVPSGAASTSHSPFSSSNSSLLPTGLSGTGSGWSASAGDTGKGGDPRTDHDSLMLESGGDPKTDHASLVTERGGDPKTDHSLRVSAYLGGDSAHLGGRGGGGGGLATQTSSPDGGYWVWSWFLGPMCLRRYTGKEIRFP